MGEYTGGESNRDGGPIGGIGRLTDGRVHSNPDGNLFNAVTGESVAPPDAPAAKDAGRPQFSKEDLAHIEAEPDAPGADLTAEEIAECKSLLQRGVYSPEELQRHRGLTDAELASLTAKPVSKVTLQQELAELRALKASDPKRYWGAEAQAKELALIRQLEAGKAEKAEKTEKPEAKTETKAEAESAEPDGLAEIEAELAKIADLRKNDHRAYDRDEAMQARERELLQAREDAKAAASFHEAGTTMVRTILDEAPDAEGLDASFMSVFDAMPEEARDAVRQAIATPVDPTWPANQAALELFSTVPAQAELAKEWGREAPKRLAVLKERATAILGANPELGHWFDALPADQAKAILRALSR